MILYNWKSVTQLAKESWLHWSTISYRLNRGITGDKLFAPPRKDVWKRNDLTQSQLRQKAKYIMNTKHIQWGDFSHLPEYWWTDEDMQTIRQSQGFNE